MPIKRLAGCNCLVALLSNVGESLGVEKVQLKPQQVELLERSNCSQITFGLKVEIHVKENIDRIAGALS